MHCIWAAHPSLLVTYRKLANILIWAPFILQGGEVSLNRRIRRHVVLRNHAKCIESIYAEEIGAAAICENGSSGQTISVRQPGGVAAAIEVVQRPSSSHLMVQLAQVSFAYLR